MNKKISETEALLELLAEIFKMTTTQVAKALIAAKIKSFDDLLVEVNSRRR